MKKKKLQGVASYRIPHLTIDMLFHLDFKKKKFFGMCNSVKTSGF